MGCSSYSTNMKKIRFLDISFENEVQAWELPTFRGAVVAMVGRDHVLFHVKFHKVVSKNPALQTGSFAKTVHWTLF